MKKPTITLKNIKHFESMSRETNCYSATIYVDGKRWGMVDNAGRGGCDNVSPLEGGWASLKSLEIAVQESDPKATLEMICSEALVEHLRRKDFKRMMKKICYVRDNTVGLYTLPAKHKPTTEIINKIKTKCSWSKDCTFLHELPDDQAYDAFLNNMYADFD